MNSTPAQENKPMTAIFIGTDRLLFKEGSAVRARIRTYGESYTHLYDFVFSLRTHGVPATDTISPRVTAYATNTRTRLGYIPKAISLVCHTINKIASTIADKDSENEGGHTLYISTQDPFETGIVGLISMLYARYVCGVAVVWNTDIHTDLYSPYFTQGSFLNSIRRIVARFIIPCADSVRVVSNRIKQSLIVRGIDEAKITVRPIVSDSRIHNTPQNSTPQNANVQKSAAASASAPVILMVGRLAPEKDYPFALDVFGKLRKAYMPHMGRGEPILCIAGDGPLRRALEKQVSTYEKKGILAKNSVRFLGNIPSEELALWYSTADVLLHTARFEGYGMVLKEASVAGLPIVTTDVGIAPDLMQENPKTTVVYKVGDRAACLAKLLEMVKVKRER